MQEYISFSYFRHPELTERMNQEAKNGYAVLKIGGMVFTDEFGQHAGVKQQLWVCWMVRDIGITARTQKPPGELIDSHKHPDDVELRAWRQLSETEQEALKQLKDSFR